MPKNSRDPHMGGPLFIQHFVKPDWARDTVPAHLHLRGGLCSRSLTAMSWKVMTLQSESAISCKFGSNLYYSEGFLRAYLMTVANLRLNFMY